jgi:hypothetical protein
MFQNSIEAVRVQIESALPTFNVFVGTGKTKDDFITDEALEMPAVFISYDTFEEGDYLLDVTGLVGIETLTIWINNDEDVYPDLIQLKDFMRNPTNNTVYIDGEERQIRLASGVASYEKGISIFEITCVVGTLN